MNIKSRSAQLTNMLCIAYKRRDRRAFPAMSDDVAYITITKLMNLELDQLIKDDRQASVSGFNAAFDKHCIS